MNAKEACALLYDAGWKFAKTMPQCPHWYTLRKDWKDSDFVELVKYIRENGRKEKYLRSTFTYLYINGFKYWTMGAPINKDGKPHTILINKATAVYASSYDSIVGKYENLFSAAEYKLETRKLIELIKPSGNVLEIGCGAGEFLDNFEPSGYTGIDISANMIELLKSKHPKFKESVVNSSLEDFVPLKSYDLVLGLYGVGSYLNQVEIEKIKSMPGRKVIMFFKEGYAPVTHIECGISPPVYTHSIRDGAMSEFGNYTVWESL